MLTHSHDLFVGNLICPNCGETSPADDSTNIRTDIRPEPELAYLGVGSRLEIDDVERTSYLMARMPAPAEPLLVLDIWECPHCHRGFLWAEVTIRAGVIESIRDVPLNREVLERIHLISDEAIGLASALSGKPMEEPEDADVVEILRRHL
ncbi:MAG: hypothetical protein GY856_11025 [bacterium]|nr:hypothetical protein [bacterium]